MARSELPSTVVDRKFISIPPEEDLVVSEGWENCGKWILTSPDADLAFLDRTWKKLHPLLKDGTLLMLKSSTTLLKSETAVFQCFTKAGKEEAKRTAQAIRNIIDHKGIMYYKMNKLTKAEIGRRFGHKHISIYMHTYLGRFYIRNLVGDWILEEDYHRNVSISRRFHKEVYSGSEVLPSKSEDSFESLPRSPKRKSNWYLKCSLSERNDAFLPEADRIWIVAKEMLTEGHIRGISWCKNARGAEIRFYVATKSDVSSQLGVCDRIRREASVECLMYFTRGNEKNIKYSFKYTAEGEFYEQTDFAEKFVLKRD